MTTLHGDPVLPAIEPGSVAAQVLLEVWSGTPAVVVSAPPGAGKTTLLVQVIEQLTGREGLRIAVAAQTRSQSVDIANRLQGALPGRIAVLASGRDKIKNKAGTQLKKPSALDSRVHFVENVSVAFKKNADVVVASTAKWCYHRPLSALEPHDFDILVIDEAWQCTAADLHEMSHIAGQFLLVGDPGQIAPVVSVDTSRFAGVEVGPHHTAPAALAKHSEELVVNYQLPSTHRCGPETTRVLQSLYPFSFVSTRPDTRVISGQAPLPEIDVRYVDASSPADPRLAAAVADRVVSLSESEIVVDGVARGLEPRDIAVGVAHVHQATAVRARLPRELSAVTVDTAERLQGLTFAATVMLDPMAGLKEVAAHNADNGRLCVMLSRATGHTTFVSTPEAVEVLSEDRDSAAAKLGVRVRQDLARAGEAKP